ncbi:glutathione S-transferase U18-like isoform X1 [Phoenix dactylifera]|uniref:Glutathione S-transferase n=1 Tax=Phoenix dactylifera TaxID=42345 RepID=A0A8B8ZYL3_PHODC|nr:glutathione S-transferase U18-like isoform X1 [Phoenix dactylifera]
MGSPFLFLSSSFFPTKRGEEGSAAGGPRPATPHGRRPVAVPAVPRPATAGRNEREKKAEQGSASPSIRRLPGYIPKKLPSAVRILIGALEGSKEQAIEQIFTTVQLLEDAFTKCCKGKKFFGGETIGYIDIAFGSWLGWLKAVEKMFGIKFFDGEKLPLLFGWAERFWSNDAVVVIMPQVDMLIEYSKAFEKKN